MKILSICTLSLFGGSGLVIGLFNMLVDFNVWVVFEFAWLTVYEAGVEVKNIKPRQLIYLFSLVSLVTSICFIYIWTHNPLEKGHAKKLCSLQTAIVNLK